MGRAESLLRTVHKYVRYITHKRDEHLPQTVQFLHLFVKILIQYFGSEAHRGNPRDVLRAGAHSVLLSAAEDQVLHLHLVADIEETGSLGRMDLVSAG